MDARREVQRISRICASRATTQTRFLAATRRDGALWAHFCVTHPHRTSRTPSGSRLELRPKRLRRMRESKSDRLPVNCERFDVVIAGAGLVGLALAPALAR